MRPVLVFAEPVDESGTVARVLPDGSIRFRGLLYKSILDAPPEWQAIRASTATYAQWRQLYQAIDPKNRPRGFPVRSVARHGKAPQRAEYDDTGPQPIGSTRWPPTR